MNTPGKSIVFDCERMKYPHTGLYHFCLHLSGALIRADTKERLCLYGPSSIEDIFGSGQCYLRQKPLHKFFFPSTNNIALWHCTHQSSGYFPFGRKVKKLLTIHDLNYLNDEGKAPDKKERYRKAVQKKIDAADHIAAISQFTLNELSAVFDLKGKPSSVIYNGCNIRAISDTAAPSMAPARPFLFTIGTITEKKNFHVLPSLLANNDFLLVIAGITQSASYKEKIIEAAMKCGVEDRVIFAGPVSENDKQWYFKNCSAFVFPSIAEGFGLPVVEAMYFGKPVLLSTFTSLPEIGGAAAYYFNSFDPDEMQDTLIKSLHDYESDPGRKQLIRERAGFFNWDAAALQYREIYERLLQ
jgi:glycosyltransferase involved in cell wall biosynthesis